jgi:predicted amidohydrolase YtcJ
MGYPMQTTMRRFLLFLLFSTPSFAQRTSVAPIQTADRIFLNGDIYTGARTVSDRIEGHERRQTVVAPRVQALAIKGDRILAVGANQEIERFKGSRTVSVDLGGHFVLPGINDSHLHLAIGGMEELNVNLVGVKSLREMQERIAAQATHAASGEWLQGGGWDHTLWAEQKLPTRQDLDAIAGGHPAFFSRIDGHIVVANTAALHAAAIAADTADPAGGRIDRDAKGEPTGILRESAREILRAKVPKPTEAKRRQAIERVLSEAAQWGLTSVQDNSEWEDFLIYEDLEREGKLTLRISEWLPFTASLDDLKQKRAHHSQSDPMLHTGQLKGFLDGSLGSHTAALLAPYSDEPTNTGLLQFTQARLNQLTRERAAAGFQIGFHAIGDGAVEMALQAFATASNSDLSASTPAHRKDYRFRIEHAQVLSPNQFARFHDLGVIASMQPNHLLTDMNWVESRVGLERAKHSYAWREFLDANVPLTFGTDYPVEPLTPFRGLYAAVTRRNEAGTKENHTEQKLTIDEAIAAYTTGAAFAESADRDKGLLQPGMLADFVVLDRDITKVQPHDILETHVLRTVVGGKTVFGL